MNWLNNLQMNNNGEVILDEKSLEYDINYSKKFANKLVLWIEGSPRVMFKSEEDGHSSVFGQLFASELAKKVGMRCIDAIPARFVFDENQTVGIAGNNGFEMLEVGKLDSTLTKQGISGLITPDYIADRTNTETINAQMLFSPTEECDHVTVEELLKRVKKFVNENNKQGKKVKIDKNLEDDILKMMCFDFAILEVDRKPINVEFTISKNKDGSATLSLSDVIDNAKCLNSYYKNFKKMWESDIMLMKKMVKQYVVFNSTENRKGLHYHPQQDEQNINLCNLNAITKAYYENANIREFITALQNVNYDEIVETIESKYKGYKVSNYHKEIGKYAFEHQVNTLNKCIETQKDKYSKDAGKEVIA